MAEDKMIKQGAAGDFKYCVDCAHSKNYPYQVMLQCECPSIIHTHHLVFGLQCPDCSFMRGPEGECGVEAILFEPKS